MKKLLDGIAEFRKTKTAAYAAKFARLALGQQPDALLICCADSRVAPNVFASVEPGDLLVVRNVGNLVPRFNETGGIGASVPAAIELAVAGLEVRDVIVCGHSGCAAIRSILTGKVPKGTRHLPAWLRHGVPALENLGRSPKGLPRHDYLSQRSVLKQVEHLRTYPMVREAERCGELRLHAWWFDIARAEVLDHDWESSKFVPLDEDRVAVLLARNQDTK